MAAPRKRCAPIRGAEILLRGQLIQVGQVSYQSFISRLVIVIIACHEMILEWLRSSHVYYVVSLVGREKLPNREIT